MPLNASPNPLAFGDVGVGTSTTRSVVVESTGQLSSAPTAQTSDPATFKPTVEATSKTSFKVKVECTPAVDKSYCGKLFVKAGTETAQVVLTANGVLSDLSLQGSYLLLKVPDYGDTTYVNATAADAVSGGIDPTPISPTKLQSYLRLGMFDYGSETPAAKELLRLIPKVNAACDPTKPVATSTIHSDANESIAGTIFVDDVRTRTGDVADSTLTEDDDPDHKLNQDARQSESAKLYSRGGWRDHSDGNRISTTWGDKVEVVRGNYKMIVMGRQNDPAEGMGWEASGAHIQDFAPGTMPGASYWLEWIDDARYYAPGGTVGDGRKGLWLLVNTTENVYEYARNAGNFREEKWGDVHEAYVGSENPPLDSDGNPSAFASDDNAGSDGHEPPDGSKIDGLNYDLPGKEPGADDPAQDYNDWRSTPLWSRDNKGKVRSNPHIIEKTWARRIDSWTGSEKCPVPVIDERKWAHKVNEETTITGTVTGNTRVAGAKTEFTTVGGAATEFKTVGGGLTEVTTVTGLKTDISVVVGGCLELSTVIGDPGLHVEAYGALGYHIQADLSAINIDFYFSALKVEIETGSKYVVRGKVKELNPEKDEVSALKTEIADAMKFLAKDVVRINAKLREVSEERFLLNSQATVNLATGHYFQ